MTHQTVLITVPALDSDTMRRSRWRAAATASSPRCATPRGEMRDRAPSSKGLRPRRSWRCASASSTSPATTPCAYKTPIFDRLAAPEDRTRAAGYSGVDFVDRVQGVFDAVSNAPDNPGTSEVCDALVNLIEMDNGRRPFRTVVSAAIQPLLEPYNTAADGLRPIVAQIFNVPELAGVPTATAS